MKIRKTSLPAALCAVFLALGAGAQERGTQERQDKRKPDAWITTKVKAALATHKNVSAVRTNVDTKGGIVTLRGEVNTPAEKELAGRYAKEVEGVRQVDNRLIVKGERSAGETEGAGDRMLDRIGGDRRKDDREPSGSGIEGAGDRALENVGNASLTGRVKAALAGQPETSAFRTDVDSDRGSVTLMGTAKSNAERDLAEKVVRGVKGVKDVDNQIEVR